MPKKDSAPTNAVARRDACDRCHRLKTRCERLSDSCSCQRCRRLGLVCAYSPPLRLGRPQGSQSNKSNAQQNKASSGWQGRNSKHSRPRSSSVRNNEENHHTQWDSTDPALSTEAGNQPEDEGGEEDGDGREGEEQEETAAVTPSIPTGTASQLCSMDQVESWMPVSPITNYGTDANLLNGLQFDRQPMWRLSDIETVAASRMGSGSTDTPQAPTASCSPPTDSSRLMDSIFMPDLFDLANGNDLSCAGPPAGTNIVNPHDGSFDPALNGLAGEDTIMDANVQTPIAPERIAPVDRLLRLQLNLLAVQKSLAAYGRNDLGADLTSHNEAGSADARSGLAQSIRSIYSLTEQFTAAIEQTYGTNISDKEVMPDPNMAWSAVTPQSPHAATILLISSCYSRLIYVYKLLIDNLLQQQQQHQQAQQKQHEQRQQQRRCNRTCENVDGLTTPKSIRASTGEDDSSFFLIQNNIGLGTRGGRDAGRGGESEIPLFSMDGSQFALSPNISFGLHIHVIAQMISRLKRTLADRQTRPASSMRNEVEMQQQQQQQQQHHHHHHHHCHRRTASITHSSRGTEAIDFQVSSATSDGHLSPALALMEEASSEVGLGEKDLMNALLSAKAQTGI